MHSGRCLHLDLLVAAGKLATHFGGNSSFAPSSLQQVQNLCRNGSTGSSCFLAALSIYNPFLLLALKELKCFTWLPSNALPSFEFLCQ